MFIYFNINYMLYFKNLIEQFLIIFINPFVPNAPFLCPLDFSGNLKIFLRFHGVEKGCSGNRRVKSNFNFMGNSNRINDTFVCNISILHITKIFYSV